MKNLGRIVLTGAAFVAAYTFTYWMSGAFLPQAVWSWAPTILSIVAGFYVARFVWRRTESLTGEPVVAAGLGAAIVGAVGFIGGFFGPMIFAPGANQGPLLGLFITGPIGVAVGAVGGLVYGFTRKHEGTQEHR